MDNSSKGENMHNHFICVCSNGGSIVNCANTKDIHLKTQEKKDAYICKCH